MNAMLSKVNRHLEQFDIFIESDYQQAWNQLLQAAKVLFGKYFILLPPCLASNNIQKLVK